MYRVEVTSSGESGFDVASKGYSFRVDNKGAGVTPPDTLLASLGTCVGVYIRKYSEGSRIPIPVFKISVEAELTKESPVRFDKIKVNVDLAGGQMDDRRKRALLEFVKNCPIHNTLKSAPAVELSLS